MTNHHSEMHIRNTGAIDPSTLHDLKWNVYLEMYRYG